jgi:hypothetical protein
MRDKWTGNKSGQPTPGVLDGRLAGDCSVQQLTISLGPRTWTHCE